MPVLERKCASGHRWDDLVGMVAGPEILDCPECGGRTIGNVPGSFMPDVCGIERMSAAEIQLGRENKADVERQAAKLHSGEMRVNQSGRIPLELRPDIPKTLH